MADTGFIFPGTAAGNRGGGSTWSTPDNIKALDDADATHLGFVSGDTSGLAGSNFGFSTSVPTGSTIDGIEIRISGFASGAEIAEWLQLRLILADDSDGFQNKATALFFFTETDQTNTVGGASDIWNESSISRDDVIDVDWGFFVQCHHTGLGTIRIDSFEMKVFYTLTLPTITDVDGDETWDDGDTGLVITGTGFV